MAAPTLQGLCQEALCSFCRQDFKDPVLIIECGHNFCRACLAQCWEGSEGEEVPCPQCQERVRRSLIIPNQQLANIGELIRKRPFPGETREGKGGVCGKHREPLKLFCKDDEAPICVVCDRSKEHRDHDVVPLEEAAQDYKDLIRRHLQLLEGKKAKILTYEAELEEESQELLKQTKSEMGKTKEQFRELISFLNKQRKLLLSQLGEVKKEIVREREEHRAGLSEERSSLEGLIREMEEKCQQPPQRTQNVTLDPETANPDLILSEDLKSVRNEERCQNVPDSLEKFDLCLYVLGREGFTASRHHWEVAVEREEDWAVGVAKKSVRRKGFVRMRTEEGIWAVEKVEGGYRVSDLPNESFLPLSGKLRKIRVSLNYEGGRVAFHDADTGSHIYTFSGASFSEETLLPFFGLWRKASLTVSS
ncbi:hypothetical protein JRQ81_012375 [Phrynocephalus forsythii]|uniref:RING-type E3 ubiquitin transferase n=1 Tax=Phrynocephalus forsythii TaxID=171643 RepID=A0A9Q0X7N3_9SAUR|nr:hypothetical protein JRQ81_012375 [Phrynocephalus forsythii]